MDGFLFATNLVMTICIICFMTITGNNIAKISKEISKIETVLVMKGLCPKEIFEKEKE